MSTISSRSPAALDLRLQPSRLLLIYLLSLGLLSSVALWLLPVSLGLRVLALALLWALVTAQLKRRAWLRGAHAVQGLGWREGSWRLRTASAELAAQCRSMTVWPWLVALDMRVGHRYYPVLVLPDQLSADELRRLRQLALQTTL